MDDIAYNAFYLLLRDRFRRKYELALSRCWNICVPCGETLRGITITDNFVDDHILKPHPELHLHFISTDEGSKCLYKVEGATIKAVQFNGELLEAIDRPAVKIRSIEKGYNKEYALYAIFILDRPLHPKYRPTQGLMNNRFNMIHGITCYEEALAFLNEFSEAKGGSLEKLRIDIHVLDLGQFESAEKLSQAGQELTRCYWASTMRQHPLDLQRDARFQKLLSTSLEVFIMHHLHDRVYTVLSSMLEQEDSYVKENVEQLANARVTPDQLGADEALSIPLPAATVELATLDARKGPLEKLLCLRSTLDLIVAEVKAALAAVEMKTKDAATRIPIAANSLTSLLMYVIVRARPRRLITDLHYIQNFLWSVSPHDGLSYTLITFEAAVSALYGINICNLPPKSRKVKITELPIEELFDVITGSEMELSTPLDGQQHQLATMLEKCTQSQGIDKRI